MTKTSVTIVQWMRVRDYADGVTTFGLMILLVGILSGWVMDCTRLMDTINSISIWWNLPLIGYFVAGLTLGSILTIMGAMVQTISCLILYTLRYNSGYESGTSQEEQFVSKSDGWA
jgi:hypothetical protein